MVSRGRATGFCGAAFVLLMELRRQLWEVVVG